MQPQENDVKPNPTTNSYSWHSVAHSGGTYHLLAMKPSRASALDLQKQPYCCRKKRSVLDHLRGMVAQLKQIISIIFKSQFLLSSVNGDHLKGSPKESTLFFKVGDNLPVQ